MTLNSVDVTVHIRERVHVSSHAHQREMTIAGDPYQGEGYGLNIGDDLLIWFPKEQAERDLMIDRITYALGSLRAPALPEQEDDFRYESGPAHER